MKAKARIAFGLAAILLAACIPVVAQTPPPPPSQADADLRERAFNLFDANRFAEARPLLERLAAAHPADIVVLERYAITLASAAMAESDPAAAKALRIKARSMFLEAKRLGDDRDLVNTMLEQLPEDGAVPSFSKQADAESAMRQAEEAFGRGELDKAREGYLKALALDPTLYEAAVFAGDTLYKQGRFDQANEWFAKAIAINPDRETAYRYWGDSLVAQGRMNDARAKYIDAIIAAPYDNTPRRTLASWADQSRVRLTVPALDPGTAVKVEDGKTTITVDPKSLKKDGPDDGGAAWIGYGITRAGWINGKFAREYPDEKAYRHSLREEAEALSAVAVAARDRARDDKSKVVLRADLAALVTIHEAGLLEAYILLFRPDAGIARDYQAYRATSRDKLRRYLEEFVVPRAASVGR
jgi:tetratricopeptide (TPR) repeat protein